MGLYVDSSNHEHLFLDSKGTFTTIDVPGSVSILPEAINASGQIVGEYFDSSGHAHGFLDKDGTITTIDISNSTGTAAFGINDSGQIVGAYIDNSGHEHGFLDSGGNITTIDFPGSIFTSALTINDSGQIVGAYRDSANHDHGYVANPPPVVEADRSNVQIAGTVTGDALTNDTSPIAKDALIVSAVDGQAANVAQSVVGTFGTLTLNADGSFTYRANNNASALPADGVGQDAAGAELIAEHT